LWPKRPRNPPPRRLTSKWLRIFKRISAPKTRPAPEWVRIFKSQGETASQTGGSNSSGSPRKISCGRYCPL
jgi:hypothetical protein